jgi:hypothetical protein
VGGSVTTTFRCGACKGECNDELGVMVELDGTLVLVCDLCFSRAEEAAEAPDAE